jgi:hypothetical protein
MYRELRALTNDKKLALNQMDLNDLYEEVKDGRIAFHHGRRV